MIIIIGAVLLAFALVVSANQTRAGFLADNQEYEDMAARGDRGNGGCMWMLAAMVAGTLALALLSAAGGGGL